MSKLEELITELCPDGVEYISIGSVMNYEQPTKYIVNDTNYNDDYSIPVLTAGQSFILGYTNETDGFYDASKEHPVIIFDDFTGAIKWVDFTFKVKSSAMKMLTAKNDIASLRYLFHIMGNIGYSSDEHKRLWISIYSAIKIPLPPLAVQREIADFKYGFTDTAKEIGAARFIRITDIGDNGKLVPNNCKFVELNSDSEKYLLEKGDILMARTGATYGKTMLFDEDVPAVYASFLIRIRFAENTILPAYYWHFSQSNLYWTQANKLVSKAGQPQFNANVLKAVNIPIPPLSEQRRIIDLLERFDALVNDIAYGLPAEIEARRKQYEYYRDKLLTFKEKSS